MVVMYGLVYKITNKITKKIYIGQTVGNLARRWSQHLYSKSGCRALSSAIKKYGKENFHISVISRCQTIEEMNHREAYYIKLFNTLSPHGYNLRTGGENSLPSTESNQKRSESLKKVCNTSEYKRLASLRMLGKPVSEEVKRKIAQSLRGNTPWNKGLKAKEDIRVASYIRKGSNSVFFGKPLSETHKQSISKANVGRVKNAETRTKMSLARKNAKPIICNETGVSYRSLAEASRVLDADLSSIRDVLKGKYKQWKGFTFSFVEKSHD